MLIRWHIKVRNNMRYIKYLSILVLLTGICMPKLFAEWHSHQFDVMGTHASIELWEEDKKKAYSLFLDIENEMRRIELMMSPYIDSSEVAAINRLSAGEPLNISKELYNLIEQSIKYSELTNGAFDISYASVGYLYNYREGIKPDQNKIDVLIDAIDYHSIELMHQATKKEKTYQIRFKKNKMRLDLGGIAKGYAVDRSITILLNNMIKSAVVSAGGDSRVIGNRGKTEHAQIIPWMIGIKHPREKSKEALRIPLINEAISTSGDYERYFIHEGERIHHILNPKTGNSAREVVTASVVGPSSTHCDALSTSLFVLGVEKGLGLINTLENYEALLIDNAGKVHYSTGFSEQ